MRTVRSVHLLVGAALWLSSCALLAQQNSPFLAPACAASADCASYLGDFDLLLQRDDQLVAVPGKRPENRSQILSEASSYLAEHYPALDLSLHFRYLSCVSNALWSERGESRTLFSAENIIETYFALAGHDAEPAHGVENACILLKTYHSRLDRIREESTILQRHHEDPDPQSIWHAILLDFARKQTPSQNARPTSAAFRSATASSPPSAAPRRTHPSPANERPSREHFSLMQPQAHPVALVILRHLFCHSAAQWRHLVALKIQLQQLSFFDSCT